MHCLADQECNAILDQKTVIHFLLSQLERETDKDSMKN